MTNMFLVLYQIGSSCIYVVFIASNLKVVSFAPCCECGLSGWTYSQHRFSGNVTGRRRLPRRQYGRADVHGVHIDPSDIDLVDKESKTPGAVLLDRHLPDHREFYVDFLLHFPGSSVIRRPRTSGHRQKHTAVLRHSALRHGSHRHGECTNRNDIYSEYYTLILVRLTKADVKKLTQLQLYRYPVDFFYHAVYTAVLNKIEPIHISWFNYNII